MQIVGLYLENHRSDVSSFTKVSYFGGKRDKPKAKRVRTDNGGVHFKNI